ncbi:MAG: DUF932 domain-containing protein [Candidatus Korarchaeota archaeon]|nr:DUF932 domain-containing protein [Candidatus Korarchaeota archaeon]
MMEEDYIEHIVATPSDFSLLGNDWVIYLNETPVFLTSHRIKARFCRYLGIKYSEITGDQRLTYQAVLKALESAPTLQFWVAAWGEVVKIASTKFVPLSHDLILESVKDALKVAREPYSINLLTAGPEWDERLFLEVTFPEKQFIVDEQDKYLARIILMNKNDVRTALKVNAGFLRLVCLNGVIAGEIIERDRLIHVKSPEEASEHIKETVIRAVESLDALDPTPLSSIHARSVKESPNELREILSHLLRSSRLARLVMYRFLNGERSRTTWGLAQALSWVSSHKEVTIWQKARLESLAWEVMQPDRWEELVEEVRRRIEEARE